jgi:hypothetical protein
LIWSLAGYFQESEDEVFFFVDAEIQPGADIEPYLEQELAAVNEMRESGFIQLLLRRPDGSGAFLLVEESSIERAQERLDALPFPQQGLMVMHVQPVDRL